MKDYAELKMKRDKIIEKENQKDLENKIKNRKKLKKLLTKKLEKILKFYEKGYTRINIITPSSITSIKEIDEILKEIMPKGLPYEFEIMVPNKIAIYFED